MAKRNPCTRPDGTPKKRWATKAAADFKAEWDAFRSGEPRYAYECPACGKWHVSSAPADEYQQRVAKRARRKRLAKRRLRGG